ncbi:hypothetical protein TRFO_19182 [Tritrichomonas foetus]|uniref:Uncharacterized protein n=1 Tax=Tritrichomonas foetus TaxID=1144522 RepID=A0A1J4KK95_9EUKA|nr:hypothetical protein TRFO_19182 [Tritrichomonas foetus]|eukprot:OHT11376.1 hypothetical protein TRFO_19182 [Tritrichomonas foetus]
MTSPLILKYRIFHVSFKFLRNRHQLFSGSAQNMTSSDYEETDSIDIYDDGQIYDDDDFNHLSRLSLQNVRKRMKKLFYDDGNIPSYLKHNIKYLHGFKEQGVKIRKFRCSSTEVIFKISAKKKTIKSGKYTNFIAKLNSRITPNEKDFLDQLSKVFSSANNTLKIDSDNYDQWNFFGKKYEIRFIRTTVKAITSYLVQLRHIEDINTIQELLDNLSPNSDIFEVSTTIFQISTAKNIDDFSLCMLFYCTTSCRPFQNEIQAELIAQFTKRKQESFRTQLAKIYLSHITSSTNFFIIRELMKLDVLHKDEVLEYVYYSQSVRAHFWFVADADDHEAYKIDGNGKNKIADDLFDLLQINQISHGFQYFPKHYQEFKELQKNNWEILRKYIEIGYNPDILATTIRNDDIDTFQQLLTNESGQYHFNKRIRPSIFDRHLIFHYKPTLIQYAALFGSIKIFKYLL